MTTATTIRSAFPAACAKFLRGLFVLVFAVIVVVSTRAAEPSTAAVADPAEQYDERVEDRT